MEDEISPTIEEYLEQIQRLEELFEVARTKQIAERVGVSLGTVTNAIEGLKQKKLVIHEPYRGVKLTEAGRKIALSVLRRHRLSERLLTDLLDVDWGNSHNYACRLEHAITEELTKPLANALGHPETCPHGNPIPTIFGGIPEEDSQPLESLDEGGKGTVKKIRDERQDLLKYLHTLNIIPGAHIEVLEKAPFDGPITIEVNGRVCPVSRKIASNIWVKSGD